MTAASDVSLNSEMKVVPSAGSELRSMMGDTTKSDSCQPVSPMARPALTDEDVVRMICSWHGIEPPNAAALDFARDLPRVDAEKGHADEERRPEPQEDQGRQAKGPARPLDGQVPERERRDDGDREGPHAQRRAPAIHSSARAR